MSNKIQRSNGVICDYAPESFAVNGNGVSGDELGRNRPNVTPSSPYLGSNSRAKGSIQVTVWRTQCNGVGVMPALPYHRCDGFSEPIQRMTPRSKVQWACACRVVLRARLICALFLGSVVEGSLSQMWIVCIEACKILPDDFFSFS